MSTIRVHSRELSSEESQTIYQRRIRVEENDYID